MRGPNSTPSLRQGAEVYLNRKTLEVFVGDASFIYDTGKLDGGPPKGWLLGEKRLKGGRQRGDMRITMADGRLTKGRRRRRRKVQGRLTKRRITRAKEEKLINR